jgi:hypothetical protein
MPTTSAKDRVSQIANGIAGVLDRTKEFHSGTTYETRQWQSGLPGYMLWWSGFETINPKQPSQSIPRAGLVTRFQFTGTLAVAMSDGEQKAQESLRAIVQAVVDAFAQDTTLGGQVLRSRIASGQSRVVLQSENKSLEMPIHIEADWAGAW